MSKIFKGKITFLQIRKDQMNYGEEKWKIVKDEERKESKISKERKTGEIEKKEKERKRVVKQRKKDSKK